ncbi:MAG: TraB/GumN family protein [Ekhidna sp.]
MKNAKLKKVIMLMVGVITGISVLTAQEKNENSLLWKVEGNGAKGSSYLFGTVHMLCEDDFAIGEKVITALKESDGLMMELDFSRPEEMAMMQQLAIGEQKISEILSEGQLEQLDTLLLARVGMGVAAMDQYALMTVNSLLLAKGLGCQNIKMYETELMAIAIAESKTIGGLELVSDQVNMFNKAYTTDFLFSQLMLIDEYMDMFDELVASYKAEEVNKLLEILTVEKFMDENVTNIILNDRNANWVNKIPSMIEKESKFIAVGAAHLGGEQGLIKLLRKKGYTVSPVL